MTQLGALLLPRLYWRHRGYFLVMAGLIWLHAIAAFDEVAPDTKVRHHLPIYQLHNDLAPWWVWGLGHGLAALVGVYGLYVRPNDLLGLRLAAVGSISMFSVFGCSVVISAIRVWPTASLMGIGFSGFVILSSLAVLQEPGINPASARPEELPHEYTLD